MLGPKSWSDGSKLAGVEPGVESRGFGLCMQTGYIGGHDDHDDNDEETTNFLFREWKSSYLLHGYFLSLSLSLSLARQESAVRGIGSEPCVEQESQGFHRQRERPLDFHLYDQSVLRMGVETR